MHASVCDYIRLAQMMSMPLVSHVLALLSKEGPVTDVQHVSTLLFARVADLLDA